MTQKSAPAAADPMASETQPLTAGSTVQQAKASMVMAALGRVKENAANTFKEAKPWGELFDKNNFGKPSNVAEASGRLRKNVSYFRVNYAIVTVGTCALVLLMNPWSVIVLAFLALLWAYFYVLKSGPVVIGGRELSEREKLMGLSAVSLIVIFFLTNVGSVIFYALGLSFLLVGLHGVLHVPDDLFLDEPQHTNGGFLSLLTGGGSSVPSAANNV